MTTATFATSDGWKLKIPSRKQRLTRKIIGSVIFFAVRTRIAGREHHHNANDDQQHRQHQKWHIQQSALIQQGVILLFRLRRKMAVNKTRRVRCCGIGHRDAPFRDTG